MKENWVSSKSIIFDIGVNFSEEDKKIYGDIDYENLKDKVNMITPPIGGIGGITVSLLIENLWNSFKQLQNLSDI